MCGIYLTNIPFEEKDIRDKLNSIYFRGPDFMGISQKEGLSFGHLRLSILDLDMRSNQPMEYENLTIVFNGEIYNFPEIRIELESLGYLFQTKGDTEVLLKGFKQWGDKLVTKLNGMFAFAIYDSVKKEVFCSRDRLGVKPFYYSIEDDKFEICSQLRPISQKKVIDEKAVTMYLDCGYVPSPYTIYKNVYKLQPGNNLIINVKDGCEISTHEYWNLQKPTIVDFSYDEAKTKLHALLKDAVNIRLQSDVPFGTFLSGGIDSALISSIASNISNNKIKTFSIGFEEKEFDESKIAAQYASIINSEHTETICKSKDVLEMLPKLIEVYDEPFADSSALPSLLLNKKTKQHVTMALSGDGGDESFLGYNHFDWVNNIDKLMKIPYVIRRSASFFVCEKIFKYKAQRIKHILNAKSIDDIIVKIFVGSNSITLKNDEAWLSYYEIFKQLSNNSIQKDADLNIKLWLENDSNVKVDRASMAFSVEVRSPFLDYRIVEFARTLPISFRYFPGKKKRILKDILKEYIPEEVFTQPKKGFSIPLGIWIRTELREEFENNLTDDFLNIVPNLNVHKFKEMWDKHMKGDRDYSSHIWRVFILSKWYQEFGFYKK